MILGGSVLALSGMFASSFCISFIPFILCYGVIGALGCGLLYMVPLICAWDYFPESRGLVTGIILSAYGLGSFAYTLIAQAIVNPENSDAVIPSGEKGLSYFDFTISARVPSMLRYLCVIWLV